MRRLTLPLLFVCPGGSSLADSEKNKFHYGGQAVIEGVMMRGPKDFTVAVRKADGEIITTTENVESIFSKFKWLNKPFLRGTLALIDSMYLGMKSLKFSADTAMADAAIADVNTAPSKDEASAKKSTVNDITVGATMILGMVLGLAIFMFVPILITKFLRGLTNVAWQLTALEGVVKIALFVGYVSVISLMPDIRRVFQYHGAEHKTINAYEAGEELTVDNVARYSKVHVRCGTSFILVVLVASILVFMLVADHLPYGSIASKNAISYLMRWLYKIALLPLVAGLAYEVIRFAGNHKDMLISRLLVSPGLAMQSITTREPLPDMIEVAIKSLQGVLEKETAQDDDVEAKAS